jgi:hypothetical protein
MMEFWAGASALAAVGQVVVLIATGWFVWRYLQETTELRRTTQQQVALANEQLEAQIRPALTIVIGPRGSLCVSNIGSGAALNLRLVRTKVESVDWEAKSNFGEPAMGAAVAVGQLVDTRSAPGSVGNLRDENLHLIYESLSRKVYASIITFNGIGQPSGVRILAKEKVAGVTYPALGTTREA